MGSALAKRNEARRKIAVTGSAGFIGSALVRHLRENCDTIAIGRNALPRPDLSGVDVVIHCAALAHRFGKSTLPYEELDKVNNLLASDLAKHAAESGVKRFVFVSTINVVAGNKPPLTPEMEYNPLNDYGRSKARAEQSLMQLKGIDIVIARPSLVYGPNAPGNLAALMRLCRSGIPLPFGCAKNSRSFLSITNAIRALEFLATAEADKVAGKIFHLAEPIPRSTAEIIAECRTARNRPARLVPVPKFVFRIPLSLLGKRAAYEQLFGDLEVDSTSLVAAGFRFVDGQPDLHAMAFANG